MIRRLTVVAALALGAALAVSAPVFAQDAKMEKRSDRITRNFERLDKNGDGVVDRSEAEKKLERSFSRFDLNADGAIDRSEIDAVRAKRAKNGKGKGGEKLVKRMQRADENRDGKITNSEYMTMLPRWFSRADENRDGRVSKAELEMFLEKKGKRRKRD